MTITRRDFLKFSALTGTGLLFGLFDLKPIVAHAQTDPLVWTNETISVCGYCSVGCSMIVGSHGGYVTYVEGNPDSPINEGRLCSKGFASAEDGDGFAVHTGDGLEAGATCAAPISVAGVTTVVWQALIRQAI